MAIRMRTNKKSAVHCEVCGGNRKNSLELFDISFTEDSYVTICDACMEVLFQKALKATCGVNHKVKSPAEQMIIRKRNSMKRINMQSTDGEKK